MVIGKRVGESKIVNSGMRNLWLDLCVHIKAHRDETLKHWLKLCREQCELLNFSVVIWIRNRRNHSKDFFKLKRNILH